MTNFLEIKTKVARCLMVGCAMVMGMSAEANMYDDTYDNTYIVLAATKNGVSYAMTCDISSSSYAQRQEVVINADNRIVYLASEEEQNDILWHTWKDSKSNIIIRSTASEKKYLYEGETGSGKPKLTTSSKNDYLSFDDSYKTFKYTKDKTMYGILLFPSDFKLENTYYITDPEYLYPIAKPYFLAEHTWRTLGLSFFGTICFPKAVRAAERAGATFYEIAAKIVDGGDFKGIVLREVTGELTAGTPYIFKKNDAETTYIVAAMHGETADAGSSNGLVGVLGDSAGEGYAVPAGMYILQDNQLWETTEGQSRILEGRAYINPDGISTTVTSAEVAGVKGYVLGLDEPFDAVRTVKTERSSEGDIRDLQGRRVERVNSGRMYIIGGRKVLIR